MLNSQKPPSLILNFQAWRERGLWLHISHSLRTTLLVTLLVRGVLSYDIRMSGSKSLSSGYPTHELVYNSEAKRTINFFINYNLY